MKQNPCIYFDRKIMLDAEFIKGCIISKIKQNTYNVCVNLCKMC